ncbi:MAG: hypothetical protein DMG49_17310 [Acidobacteria bacterium]|nr:MAG: hypothetical protein DMG49_17310 [Acidobacteriota bacterium]
MTTKPLLVWLVVLLVLVLNGCGGTWVDDSHNFERVFGFNKPADVHVIHSYYWKSSHWSTEYRYLIALRPSSKFTSGLTSPELMTAAIPDATAIDACGDKRPQWFVPKPFMSYEMWVSRRGAAYRVFRDKADGTLFVCDERL